MSPRRLSHLAIVVADLGRAEAFYADVLGLPVIARHADATGAPRAVWLGLADGFLALERAGAADPRRGDAAPGLHCLALRMEVGERTELARRLVAAGAPLERESDYSIYARDPDGVLVAFSSYPEPSRA